MKKIALFSFILSSILVSCNSSSDNNDETLVPISLTSNVVIEGREKLQNTQIANGQQVSFFVTEASNTANTIYSNVLLTADGEGNFSYSSDGQTILYYPVEPINVDFYAIHPYAATNTLGSVYNFEIKPDQSTLSNYYNSDLLYSEVKDIVKTRNTIPMIFNHKLSKINLVVKEGVGMDLSNLSSVQIMNVIYQIGMNISDGALVPVQGTETEVNMYGVQGTTGNETQVSGITAIIVPQSFVTDASKRLFRLTISGVDYYYAPPVGILYEEGKAYNYTLTVNNSGVIEVTSSITDWLPGDDITGDVE